MAHFAVICPEDAGHLLSIGPLGTELVRRGHRVTIVARAEAASLAQQLQLPLHKLPAEELEFPLSAKLTWAAFYPFGAAWLAGLRNAFCWRAEFTLRLAPQALRELEVDGLIVDQIVSAAGSAAEHVGIPFVTVCSALLWNQEPAVPPHFTAWRYRAGLRARLRNRVGYAAWRWYMRPVLKIINRYRKAWSLRPLAQIDDAFSPLAQISQLCPEFDYPRTTLPGTFHYIGSLAAGRRVNLDDAFPWDRLDGRPLIFASLGTVPDATNLPVFRTIAAACAGLDAQLVLSLGKWSGNDHPMREQLGKLPGDPLLVDFAPQLALLDRAALLITHAGVNTVLEAFSRGVPMVALPRSADQPGMAARVEHAGAGLCGSFLHSTPAQVRQMVERVLAEDTFRRRARELGASVLAAGGVERAADVAEEALTTARPVTRREAVRTGGLGGGPPPGA